MEANIGQEIFRVKSINGNDISLMHARFYRLVSYIKSSGALNAFSVFPKSKQTHGF